jgi:hypothetical protein
MIGKLFALSVVIFSFSTFLMADTVPFDLSIKGGSINVHKSFELSDVNEGKTEINFDLSDKSGKKYIFDLKYKKLPSNRSYPTNLDITFKDADGNKLGYLFFANNGVKFLKQMGTFGLIVNVDGELIDIKFTFEQNKKGAFSVASLNEERFVQDTLVSKFSFQMIRPVIVPLIKSGVRSKTYSLDNHPYEVNYTIQDIENGLVEFQHNLNQVTSSGSKLLERIYFYADSQKTLREAMYAGKYFHKSDGVFKLVFYPAMGQTEPNK